MSKSSKILHYIMLNILCAAVVFIGCYNSYLRLYALAFLEIVASSAIVVSPYIVIINCISIYTVIKDKMKISTVLSLLGGSLGGFITARVLRKKSLVINVIFNISVWFAVWVIVGGGLSVADIIRYAP